MELTGAGIADQRALVVQSSGNDGSNATLDMTDFVGRNLLSKGAKSETNNSYNGSKGSKIPNGHTLSLATDRPIGF